MRPGLGIRYTPAAVAPAVRRILATGTRSACTASTPTTGRAAAEILELAGIAGRAVSGCGCTTCGSRRPSTTAALRSGLSYDSTVMDRSHLDPERLPLAGPRVCGPGWSRSRCT